MSGNPVGRRAVICRNSLLPISLEVLDVREGSILVTRFGRKKSAMTQQREKRKSERVPIKSPAFVETPASRQSVTVVDYSATGVRLTSSSPPPSRRDVCLNINGLAIFGTIAWRRDNCFGIKFEESLNDFEPAELEAALEEAQVYGREFDREAVLKELANKEPDKDGVEEGCDEERPD